MDRRITGGGSPDIVIHQCITRNYVGSQNNKHFILGDDVISILIEYYRNGAIKDGIGAIPGSNDSLCGRS
jgi:hypothetical protein